MNVIKIDSRSNPKIKYVSRLLTDKSFRKKEKKLVIENKVMVDEAITCGILPESIFVDENALKKDDKIYEKYTEICENLFIVSSEVMHKISDLETPQGITAVISSEAMPRCDICKNGKYVLLERVGDPGNIGTVIRTADAFGFDGVILTEGCADVYAPKVMRSTMGGIFRVPVIVDISVEAAVDKLKNCGVTLLAAVLDKEATELKTTKDLSSVAVMIGNEAAGLTQKAIELADRKVYIGMNGGAESLNAAVAAAIFMYHLS